VFYVRAPAVSAAVAAAFTFGRYLNALNHVFVALIPFGEVAHCSVFVKVRGSAVAYYAPPRFPRVIPHIDITRKLLHPVLDDPAKEKSKRWYNKCLNDP